MARFRLLTVWRLEAPIDEVCRAISESLLWPTWWKGAERVVELEPGDSQGIGSLRRYTWKSVLPYRLTFDARVIRAAPPFAVDGVVTGEVEGFGAWRLSQRGPMTTVHYHWEVRTNRPWLNLLAPLARPLFEWNHDLLMQNGAAGLARLLDARLLTPVQDRGALRLPAT
ncbi:MAG: SRPBCC family protein [Betaproteobacteria bacterium]|nr:SRPBCC family protein [Betaproteobacteria bacterium]